MNSFKLGTVVAMILFALALAPTAIADDWYRDRVAATADTPLRPDDRGGRLGVGGAVTISVAKIAPTRPDDRTGIRGPGPSSVQLVPVGRDSRFDWSDSMIGAIAGAGAAVLALGLVLTARIRSKGHHVPA